MKRYVIVMASIIALVVIGGVFAVAGASARDRGPRTITVIRVAHASHWQGDTETPDVGDRFEFTARLFQHGEAVGFGGTACTVVRAGEGRQANLCQGTYKLPGGTISTQVFNVLDRGFTAIAITGGTGTYRGASGQATFEPLSGSRARLIFELI